MLVYVEKHLKVAHTAYHQAHFATPKAAFQKLVLDEISVVHLKPSKDRHVYMISS